MGEHGLYVRPCICLSVCIGFFSLSFPLSLFCIINLNLIGCPSNTKKRTRAKRRPLVECPSKFKHGPWSKGLRSNINRCSVRSRFSLLPTRSHPPPLAPRSFRPCFPNVGCFYPSIMQIFLCCVNQCNILPLVIIFAATPAALNIRPNDPDCPLKSHVHSRF